MVTIRTATVTDAPVIHKLAEATWYPSYQAMLEKEQITYMLDLLYNVPLLESQITTGEQVYLILSEDGKDVAFAAYAPRTTDADIYKLHKLYCLPECKGKGYGRTLVETVEKAVLNAGKSIFELNVNRNNPALDFYKKSGFEIIYEEDIDIGNGYWMNDYVMRKLLQ